MPTDARDESGAGWMPSKTQMDAFEDFTGAKYVLEALIRFASPVIAARDAEINRLTAENAALRERVAKLEEIRQAADEFRDSVLHDRGALAENGMSNDQTNDVLSEFDYYIGAAIDAYDAANPPAAQKGADDA